MRFLRERVKGIKNVEEITTKIKEGVNRTFDTQVWGIFVTLTSLRHKFSNQKQKNRSEKNTGNEKVFKKIHIPRENIKKERKKI